MNCKIKGVGVLILGAQGRQLVCYTNVQQQLTPPKAPGGGGFACQQYSLGYLYEQYKFKQNIWTKTNIGTELCRYLYVKFTFYRHPYTDFIISYERQPPFEINQYIYAECHPLLLLLSKHKKLLLSKETKPNGPLKKTIKIKPPKQMITKWFFQEDFCKFPLLLIKAAACSFTFPHITCCGANQILTFFYLSPSFYKTANWAAHPPASTTPYTPYPATKHDLYTCGKTPPPNKTGNISQEDQKTYDIKQYIAPKTYDTSINYDNGWFCKQILSAVRIYRDLQWDSWTGLTPTNTVRYNPTTDDGKNNIVWLKSTLNTTWDVPSDPKLYMKEIPLWLALHGWLSYLQMQSKDKRYFETYIVCMKSPSLSISSQPVTDTIVVPIDAEFRNGKWPFDEPITHGEHVHWWPNVYHQLNILNQIVCCGPYIPKFDSSTTRNSTWELHYYYQFFFKWGGPELPDQPVTDPCTQGTYIVPDHINAAIQIRDPAKQTYESIIHPWDYRRGLIKTSALKRMSEHLSIDSTFQPDGEPPRKKKITGPQLTVPEEETQEIQSCLLSLCKEDIYQETEETDLLKLIQHQQQQQQELKYNLLKLLSEMKQKQRQLQLQTGLLN